jgi:hypothetical protein
MAAIQSQRSGVEKLIICWKKEGIGMESWILLLIPAIALFAWYWGFWRKFNPSSTSDRSNPPDKADQLLAGYQLRQSGNKRYIKSTPTAAGKKRSARTGGKKSGGVKKSAARAGRKK